MLGYPKNAPVSSETADNDLIEGFIAGNLAGRQDERNRLYEALMAAEVTSIDYEEYIKLDYVLELLKYV